MNLSSENLFDGIPESSPVEVFTTLLNNQNCRIERIVSYGQGSPDGFWFDQAWDEWVLLLQGCAELNLAGHVHRLVQGSHLFIPAGVRHRVIQTAKGQQTIWLAVHLNKNSKC